MFGIIFEGDKIGKTYKLCYEYYEILNYYILKYIYLKIQDI